ncbi:WD domain-containing protein [Xylariomycetidae sp. FL2044]|nr:WD domain-containing protein [Xylariomycetidae sp. FL2044]
MSNAGPSNAAASSGASFTPQPPPTPGVPATTNSTTTGTTNNQNLNQIVTDYLLKKGYKRTEEIFRQEVKDLDESSRPRQHNEPAVSEKVFPAGRYLSSFSHFERWVDNGLDLYKFELNKVLWPSFVYSYLRLVKQGSSEHAKQLLQEAQRRFDATRFDELKTLATITLAIHVRDNSFAKLYLENKYHIPISNTLVGQLFHYLEREYEQCGAVILGILQEHCTVESVDRGPIEPFSFEAIYRRARNQELDEADVREGIPGIQNKNGPENRNFLDASARLKLGPMPMEPELRADLVSEMEEEDRINPPKEGARSLVEEFNSLEEIKKESGESPQRTDVPYPPSRARDVVMELQKVKEYRDRFRIEGRTGGVGPAVSVCMFTFHNHLGSFNCIDFSNDHQLVAVGTAESYIRVWNLEGKPLKSLLAQDKDSMANNRKLIGHSAPVFNVAFSDATTNSERNLFGGKQLDTGPKLLISCSADGQVRLWSLDAWSCICVYKGHDGPVFDVSWSPQGHYFVTGGWDKTVRVWSQDHASAQRLMIGHETAISVVGWHPNGAYVFSASDETDKSIRMWSVNNGECVRMFIGHTEYISALECAPNGKILASADIGGNIMLWDLEKGTRIKRCRGHGRGGIWSLSFGVESNILVSGGQDNTVRVWDVEMPTEGTRPANQQDGDGTNAATGGQGDGKQSGTSAQATSGTVKKRGKEVMTTPDQISAFQTKKTPVTKVKCTRMNLVVAGGCYYPETQDRDTAR